MDKWGAAGCEERFDEIVGTLVNKAREIGWLNLTPTKALQYFASRWVRRAIDDAKKKSGGRKSSQP